MCLPIFSSSIRAADYARTLAAQDGPFQYQGWSPAQFVELIPALAKAGIDQLVLDRCPRCEMYTAIGGASFTDVDRVLGWWGVVKASEFARLWLYLGSAQALAGRGVMDVARDVALSAVAHVSLEDPRAHLLLGQLAVALQDRQLRREAQAFLRILDARPFEKKLQAAVRSGEADFGL